MSDVSARNVSATQEGWRRGDYLRFSMGTIWIYRCADLTPVHAMIFRRFKSLGNYQWAVFYHMRSRYLLVHY